MGMRKSRYGLEIHGIKNTAAEYWNLSTPALVEAAIRRHEGVLAHAGPLVVQTGHHTGRSPNDKFIVKESSSEKNIWWGKVNRPIDAGKFAALYQRMISQLHGKDLFVQDCFAGADPHYRLPVRIVTETAWHNLFARNLFIRARQD